MERIAQAIPTKSLGEIKHAIMLYEKRAVSMMKNQELECNGQAPLDEWAKLFKEISPETCANEDIITTLKYICVFEKHTETGDINFRDCYEFLIATMEGKAPKELDEKTMEFLMSTFSKLAIRIKEEDNNAEKEFIDSLTMDYVMRKTYTNKKFNILTDDNINPLKIPVNLLKMPGDLC